MMLYRWYILKHSKTYIKINPIHISIIIILFIELYYKRYQYHVPVPVSQRTNVNIDGKLFVNLDQYPKIILQHNN